MKKADKKLLAEETLNVLEENLPKTYNIDGTDYPIPKEIMRLFLKDKKNANFYKSLDDDETQEFEDYFDEWLGYDLDNYCGEIVDDEELLDFVIAFKNQDRDNGGKPVLESIRFKENGFEYIFCVCGRIGHSDNWNDSVDIIGCKEKI